MTEDELERLRAADPAVLAAPLPSAEEPRARALFERITMNDTQLEGPEASEARVRRRRFVTAAAAAVLLVAVVGAGIAIRGGDDAPDSVATPPVPAGNAPITMGGASSGSCVERYDLGTLRNREVAFDGTVRSVDGDTVRFTVNEWYRGGDTPTASLRGAQVLGGMTSAGPSVGLTPGARLLVAGDGGFAWACGFTQPYDAAVAADWSATLGR